MKRRSGARSLRASLVAVSVKPPSSATSLRVRPSRSSRLQRYRTGAEGSISHLKRGYGLRRSRC